MAMTLKSRWAGRMNTVRPVLSNRDYSGTLLLPRMARLKVHLHKTINPVVVETPQILKTPAGSFTVDRILTQHYHYRVLVTSLDTGTVEFIDPSVPFGVVRSLQDIDIGGLFFAKLVATVGEFQMTRKNPYDLYQALQSLDLSNQVKQNFELINP